LMDNVTIISSGKNWMEQTAVEQLHKIAALPGVVKAVGLPDLHPGKTPVGAVIITENMIYPHLIGNDIGCGMSLFRTEIERRKMKLERMIKRIESIDSLQAIDLPEGLLGDRSWPFAASLGSIGGGNHFAELQVIEAVLDTERFDALGFDREQVMALIHSGSRGWGGQIYQESITHYQAQNGLESGSDACKDYLAKHNAAIEWAALNRRLSNYRFLKALGVNPVGTEMINSTHNSITYQSVAGQLQYIHRKGAAPADQGMVVIPGSRGSLTYLVIPTGDISFAGYSLAHGAGRKWERAVCKARLENKYTKETIRVTKFRGRVVCNDPNLLFEEAPESYKNIDTVMQSLVELGLLKVIATLKPILTYKG
jgi:release factor H-coupled RctB family protein